MCDGIGVGVGLEVASGEMRVVRVIGRRRGELVDVRQVRRDESLCIVSSGVERESRKRWTSSGMTEIGRSGGGKREAKSALA